MKYPVFRKALPCTCIKWHFRNHSSSLLVPVSWFSSILPSTGSHPCLPVKSSIPASSTRPNGL
eukprot:scaffold840_cov344-Pavlova_lutheri.AAC.10